MLRLYLFLPLVVLIYGVIDNAYAAECLEHKEVKPGQPLHRAVLLKDGSVFLGTGADYLGLKEDYPFSVWSFTSDEGRANYAIYCVNAYAKKHINDKVGVRYVASLAKGIYKGAKLHTNGTTQKLTPLYFTKITADLSETDAGAEKVEDDRDMVIFEAEDDE